MNSTIRRLQLQEQPGRLAVCRLEPDAEIPAWATTGRFFSITRANDELSIVCSEADVPGDIRCEREWRCLRIVGAMAFTETGVLASLDTPLAVAGISVFAIATFDTDYLLVKANDWDSTLTELKLAGHEIQCEAITGARNLS